MASLKNEIIGTWKLLSYIEIPVGGEEYMFPLGTKPQGTIIFSPDGFMSVQISVQNAEKYDNEDRYSVSDDKLAARSKRYIAFSGKYSIDNALSCVTYHIDISLNPNWEGAKQIRKMDFEADIMYQKSLEPIYSAGQYVHPYMTWQKMDKHQVNEEELDSEIGEII